MSILDYIFNASVVIILLAIAYTLNLRRKKAYRLHVARYVQMLLDEGIEAEYDMFAELIVIYESDHTCRITPTYFSVRLFIDNRDKKETK